MALSAYIKSKSELIEYVTREFVDSGFIKVYQWRNFIDYLQILLDSQKVKEVSKDE